MGLQGVLSWSPEPLQCVCMFSARGQESWVAEKSVKEIDDGSASEGNEGIRRHVMRNGVKECLGLEIVLAGLWRCSGAWRHSDRTVGSVEEY